MKVMFCFSMWPLPRYEILSHGNHTTFETLSTVPVQHLNSYSHIDSMAPREYRLECCQSPRLWSDTPARKPCETRLSCTSLNHQHQRHQYQQKYTTHLRSEGKLKGHTSPRNAMRRVAVTGLGAVTPLAAGIKQTWHRLLASHSGLVSTDSKGPAFASLPSRVAGLVPLGSRDEGCWQAQDWLPASEERQMALFAQYAVASAHEALSDAGWFPTREEELERTGVTLGSGIGNLDEAYSTSVAFDKGGYRKVSPLFVPRLLINLAAGHVSMRYGFKGPNHAATTACTTGLHAIGDASRMIAFGDADVMVAGGAEACVHPLAVAGFARARSLATDWNEEPEKASRPFDRGRAGFVIGEGAGVVVLEVGRVN